MRQLLQAHCDHVEESRSGMEPVLVSGYRLPAAHLEFLRVANGLVSKRTAFRLFGIEPTLPALDLLEWNRSPWVAEYGALAAGLVFIAEDIFGDQYGWRFSDAADQNPVLVKFWCEGGETEVIEAGSLSAWLTSSMLRDKPTGLDRPLVAAAFAQGLRPSVTEHLSFVLPLIAGGAAEVSNLEVADRAFHLHLLGQLSLKNQRLPEGTRINRFWSES